MAFLEILKEMLSRQQVADLASNVAVVSLEREKEGNPRKYLNINYATKGEVEWVDSQSPSIFVMKGKFLRDVYPQVKGKLGKSDFVDREKIRGELGHGSTTGIATDIPRKFVSLGREDR
jgi:hypothetical protein